jgi:AcrR family transcriptional regulator
MSEPVLRWVKPPRQARSQQTLDRLLDAAEALVREKGFDDVPIDEALDPARWEGARIEEIVVAVVRFLVEIYRERRGLMRAFAIRNRTNAGSQARRERLSQHVSAELSALLLERRGEIRHADPEHAAAFALTLAFSALDNAILFGEMRSGAFVLSDADLAAELARAMLAYLGVPLPPASTSRRTP